MPQNLIPQNDPSPPENQLPASQDPSLASTGPEHNTPHGTVPPEAPEGGPTGSRYNPRQPTFQSQRVLRSQASKGDPKLAAGSTPQC